MEQQDINRLLLKYEQLLRETNREAINPLIQVISLDDLRPVAKLVARSRGIYLKALYDLAHQYENKDSLPSDDEMNALRATRRRYLDLVDGSQSVEIAIQRGYLDIKDQRV